jgi:hypothetical protein
LSFSKTLQTERKMALPRPNYIASLAQLNNNIAALEQQAVAVENSLEQARFQRSVSTLFVELNDSTEKSTVLPLSTYVHSINAATGFYKLEAIGDYQLKVHRDGDKYTAPDSKCYFLKGELATLTKEATFDAEGNTTITVPGYKATPAYFFPGCEPESKVSVAEVAVGVPQGAHLIQVAQPAEPTVPLAEAVPQPSTASA